VSEFLYGWLELAGAGFLMLGVVHGDVVVVDAAVGMAVCGLLGQLKVILERNRP
jgi:hypothetical protein